VLVTLSRHFLRAAVFAGFALAISTFARPAHALMAPFCDDRGATAMAPAPALEAPDVAIGRARIPLCEAGERSLFAVVTPGQPIGDAPSADADYAVPLRPALLSQAEERLADPPILAARPRGGVRSRVERPPRG
jgi:hypothetical protein